MTSSADLSRSGPLEIAARLDRLPLSRWHWRIVLLCGLATFFDVYEIYMSGILGSVLDKEWHLNSFTKPLLIGSPYFGMIFGAIVLGFVADRFGRRPMFMMLSAAGLTGSWKLFCDLGSALEAGNDCPSEVVRFG
jgi:putative MFS transporter